MEQKFQSGKLMKIKQVFFWGLLAASLTPRASFTYEIHEGNSTVTPGCEGGVLYSKTESWFSTTPGDESDFIVPNMVAKLQNLTENSFAFVDLGLTQEELDLFDKIIIEDCIQYDRFGNLSLLSEEIPNFLRDIGNDDPVLIQSITDIICKITSNVMQAFQNQTAWVLIRSSVPHPFFDMPRWHMDGYYYSPMYGPQYKFATALKGNPTLFYPLEPTERNAYLTFHQEFWEGFILEDIGKWLQKLEKERAIVNQIFDIKVAQSPKRGWGAFFIVGDPKLSALHSEPKIDSDRLFIAILPGHESQIEEFYQQSLKPLVSGSAK